MATNTVTGGDKFAAKIRELERQLADPPTLQVGFINNATYTDGTSVATIAFLNEFGTGRIPPRPFFRNMIAQHKNEWSGNMMILLKRSYDLYASLNLLGTLIASQLRQSILSNTPPPNAPATIARKGHGTTLVDTGLMSNSVDYEIIP